MKTEGENVSDSWNRVLRNGMFGWLLLASAFMASFFLLALEYGLGGGPTTGGYGTGFGQPGFATTPETSGVAVALALIYLLLFFYPLAFHVVAAVALYKDAVAVGRADVEWNPSPGLYAVAGFFFSILAVLHYLWKRYEYLPPTPTSPLWGKFALLCVLVGVGAVALGTLLSTAGLFLGLAVVPLLAMAVYQDARSVRYHTDWAVNPISYFTYTAFSVILFVVPFAVGGYYLYRRESAS